MSIWCKHYFVEIDFRWMECKHCGTVIPNDNIYLGVLGMEKTFIDWVRYLRKRKKFKENLVFIVNEIGHLI